MKLSDMKLETERLFVLMKGEPGCGKSVAAGGFPGPIYFFDCDGRMKPVRTWFPDRTDIEYDTYVSASDFVRLKTKLEGLQSNNPYKTIVMDSLTSLADLIISYMISVRGRDGGKKKGVIELAEIEDFGGESRGLGQMLEIARSLKCHFILTAHVLETQSYDISSRKTTISRTLMTGGKKVAAKIPGYFDEIWHFNQKSAVNISDPPIREIYTAQAGEDFAKTAMPLPQRIEFTNKKLFDVVADILKAKKIELIR